MARATCSVVCELAERDDVADAAGVLRLGLHLVTRQPGVDDAGGDHVDEDLVGRQLAGHRPRQHAHAGFRRRVGGDLGPGHLLHPGAGEDDAAGAPALDHQPGRRLTEVEAAGEVDVEMLLPLLRRDLQEGDAVADRRVADGDVERIDRRQRRVDGFPVADVGLDVGDVAVLARPLQPRLGLCRRSCDRSA